MANKNIQIKIKSGDSWDNLFPKTKAAITELNNGKSVEEVISEILSTINTKASLTDVENKIKSIIGSAPGVLDTLQELAAALNNDSNFATTITNLLANKVDKVSGKQLSTQDFTTELKTKLESLKINADGTAQVIQYVHPSTHPATIIAEDITHRFATDAEKQLWGSKTKINTTSTEDKSADLWFQEI